MPEAPRPDLQADPPDPLDRSNEDPGNFKRTPPEDEVQQDPLNSGRFTSNQLLLGTLLVGALLALLLVAIYS
ncbi:MAG: hypothetical protein AB7F65_07700 [Dehalococcoidia bacterium]